MSSRPSTLSAAAQDRKARLAQLRSLKRKQPEPSDDNDQDQDQEAAQDLTAPAAADEDDVRAKYLSGRNFDHSTGGAKLGFENAPHEDQDTVEKQATILAERMRITAEDDEKKDEPLDLFKLQPKKPNWDLKRDLKQRMEILDIRTDSAIARLVRERIESQKKKDGGVNGQAAGLEGVDLVEAVHVREREEADEEQREREWEAELAS